MEEEKRVIKEPQHKQLIMDIDIILKKIFHFYK